MVHSPTVHTVNTQLLTWEVWIAGSADPRQQAFVHNVRNAVPLTVCGVRSAGKQALPTVLLCGLHTQCGHPRTRRRELWYWYCAGKQCAHVSRSVYMGV